MYDEIMRAAQAVAQSIEINNNRITILEAELNKEKIKKQEIKQQLIYLIEQYFDEE